jgi:sterol desaturase/sphingolipid hydroxylase (fatty acid hydroxylase superfamily)
VRANPDTWRLAVFLAGLAVLYAAETVWPRRAWHAPRLGRLALHGGVALANTVVMRLTVAGPLVLLASWVHREGWGLATWIGLRGLPEILASLVVLDLADYAWHRANHRLPFLWRFHAPHHGDTGLDVTTALRFHPGELLLSGIVKASWIFVWGPSAWGFAVFEIGISLAAQYHHANIDLPDRVEPWLRAIQVTPRMHASHHSAYTGSLDANFSTIFSVWDRIFGTYVRPAGEHLGEVGLPYGRSRDTDLVHFLARPFRGRCDLPESMKRPAEQAPSLPMTVSFLRGRHPQDPADGPE